jgi:type IV pilus assembly protein PilC
MKFNFKAKTKSGELKEGVVEAVSVDSAIEVLQKNELFPITIKEDVKKDLVSTSLMRFFEKVDEKELMMFFRQLAILIEAKVPIAGSLAAIGDETLNRYFKAVINEMINDVRDGLALSDAMTKHRRVFSSLAINIIKSGEASGNMKKSVDYVARNIEKNYNLGRKVKSALMYPGVVLGVFFVIAFLVMTFIVPKLTAMIKSLDVPIPWYTQNLIVVSDFMTNYWWAVIVAIIGVIGGIVYYIKSEEGKKEWHYWQLHLPIVGEILRNVYIARFADNLNILLVGGIPIVNAITLAGSVSDNTVYQEIFGKVAEEVKRGGTMSTVLKRSELIPPIVSQMVGIGEESGEIDVVLGFIAKFYEQETDTAAKNLSTLLEPVLMIIIGLAVGVLVISIIMPIYNIAGQIK